MNLKRLALAICIALVGFALSGCANQTIRIKAVDANGQQPLAHVTTRWAEHRYQMFQEIKHYPPTNLPPTDATGVVEIKNLHRNRDSSFAFSCPNYSTVYGRYSGGILTFGTEVTFYDKGMLEGDFLFGGKFERAFRTNELFVIKMPKSNP